MQKLINITPTKDGDNMSNQKPVNTTQNGSHGDYSKRGAQTPAPRNPPPMPKVQPAKPAKTTK